MHTLIITYRLYRMHRNRNLPRFEAWRRARDTVRSAKEAARRA